MSKKRSKNRRANGPDNSAAPVPDDAPAMDPPPHAASDVPATAAAGEEVRRLRAALDAERSARAALELRLRGLEDALRRAEAPPAQPRLAPEDLGVANLRALAGPDAASGRDYAGFEHWLMEANLRADAGPAARLDDAGPGLYLPLVADSRETAAAAPVQSVTEDRLLQKLRAAREALDTAESKAAHNAAQVRRLTSELAAARSEHTRAASRVRDLEARVAMAEGRPIAPAAVAPLALDPPGTASPMADSLPPIHLDKPAPDALENLEDALASWGGAATAGVPTESGTEDPLADALEAWGGDTSDAAASVAGTSDNEFDRAMDALEATAPPATGGLEDALLGWDAPGLDANLDAALLDVGAPEATASDAIETPTGEGDPVESVFDFGATPSLDLNDAPEVPDDDADIIFVGEEAAPATEADFEPEPNLADAMLSSLGAEALETPDTESFAPSSAASMAEEALAAMAAPEPEVESEPGADAQPDGLEDALLGALGGADAEDSATEEPRPSDAAEIAEGALAAMAAPEPEIELEPDADAQPDGLEDALLGALGGGDDDETEADDSEALAPVEEMASVDVAGEDFSPDPELVDPVRMELAGEIAEAPDDTADFVAETPESDPIPMIPETTEDEFAAESALDLDSVAATEDLAPDGEEAEPVAAAEVADDDNLSDPESPPVDPVFEAEDDPNAGVPAQGEDSISLYATLQARRAERDAPVSRDTAGGQRRAVSESLQMWSGLRDAERDTPPRVESAPMVLDEAGEEPDEAGSATMVNALLRFMRPK